MMNIKNGQRMLMLSIFILLSVNCNSYRKVQKSNQSEIDKVKSSISKEFVERNITGYWVFDKLTTPAGETIKEKELQIDTLRALEIISRPDVVFHNNMEYQIMDNDTIERGDWSYDAENKLIKFIFDEPKYNFPVDKLSPNLLKQLKDEGSIIELKENSWEIHELTPSTLSIIEHLPHNEFELKYNFRLYRRKK